MLPSNIIHLFEIVLLLFKTDVKSPGWIWDFNQKASSKISLPKSEITGTVINYKDNTIFLRFEQPH